VAEFTEPVQVYCSAPSCDQPSASRADNEFQYRDLKFTLCWYVAPLVLAEACRA